MNGTNSYNLILQPRDQRIVDALDVMRVIDREQAAIVAPFGSTTRANTRLLALTRAGVLSRTLIGTIAGGRRAVYFLPKQSPRLLKPTWRDHAFAHQLALNQVYLSAGYQPPQGTELLEWRRFTAPLSEQLPLIPDGYANLSLPDGQVGFFVEVDLGTEPLRVWEKKVRLYLELALSGEFTRNFGLPQFRVLVIAPGFRRMYSILKTIKASTDKIFWLTTMEAMRRQGLFAPIWTRPDERTRLPLWVNAQGPAQSRASSGGRAGSASGSTAQGRPAP
jgi:Replication-relaxation